MSGSSPNARSKSLRSGWNRVRHLLSDGAWGGVAAAAAVITLAVTLWLGAGGGAENRASDRTTASPASKAESTSAESPTVAGDVVTTQAGVSSPPGSDVASPPDGQPSDDAEEVSLEIVRQNLFGLGYLDEIGLDLGDSDGFRNVVASFELDQCLGKDGDIVAGSATMERMFEMVRLTQQVAEIEPTGVYDAVTIEAVADWQRAPTNAAAGLDDDGRAGTRTFEAMGLERRAPDCMP